MTKTLGLVLTMLLALGLGGCGDDDGGDEGGGNASGAGNGARAGSGSGSRAGSGSGSGSGDGVFSNYDCDGAAASGTCDQAICALESAYDSLQMGCGGGAANAFCDAVGDCILELTDCFEGACPTGSMATAAATSCVSTYLTCIQNATGAASTGG
jgi:hypothetical protein